jgi:hypothetical protein
VKTEFVLSSDNYVELGEERLRTPSRSFATIAAFSGLGLILLGYCLLHFWPDRDPRAGLLALFGGLFLTLSAAVLAFFPRQVRSEKAEALLRSEHERFFSDRRSFEFDDTGWKYESGRGEDVRKWSELTGLRDSPTVIVLSTSGSVYIVPKSALKPEDLEKTKDLSGKALDAPGAFFQVSVAASAQEYVLAMLSYNWRRNWKAALLWYAVALTLLVAITYPSADHSLINHPRIIFFVFAVCFLGECFYYIYLYYQTFQKNAPTAAAVMVDRVGFWARNQRWIVKYQWLTEIRETRLSFHIYYLPTSFYLIPKKGFDRDQLTRLRELLHSQHSRRNVSN